MRLPFSHEAFLEVFGRYNDAMWPAVLALWALTLLMVLAWLRKGVLRGRIAYGLLAVHWGWSAVAYHWMFFRIINPAATGFSALFAAQAAVFAVMAAASRGRVQTRRSLRGVMGAGLAVYGLAYPFIGLGLGLQFPRMPLFAVPCPTVLVTAGILVTSADVPRVANVIPFLWALIGSSAAFALGIRADLALVVAAAALLLDTVWPRALGPRN